MSIFPLVWLAISILLAGLTVRLFLKAKALYFFLSAAILVIWVVILPIYLLTEQFP